MENVLRWLNVRNALIILALGLAGCAEKPQFDLVAIKSVRFQTLFRPGVVMTDKATDSVRYLVNDFLNTGEVTDYRVASPYYKITLTYADGRQERLLANDTLFEQQGKTYLIQQNFENYLK
ncbi:hypothetical protein [Hymenobacter metallicola]|uniref:Uncharacterized protein n=1 Tax=Hymenobacter metallicola TaxID=2563114 RepID=A0A4Z0QM82_9BACT|nr:hypothetical protein [Hymenobacter metallicola]TGE29852.1 hypothetical protein E5K02_10440 [Hymenobacter metallicola]